MDIRLSGTAMMSLGMTLLKSYVIIWKAFILFLLYVLTNNLLEVTQMVLLMHFGVKKFSLQFKDYNLKESRIISMFQEFLEMILDSKEQKRIMINGMRQNQISNKHLNSIATIQKYFTLIYKLILTYLLVLKQSLRLTKEISFLIQNLWVGVQIIGQDFILPGLI